MIENLKRYENDCTNGINTNFSEICKDLNDSKKCLTDLTMQFNDFNLTENKLTDINERSDRLNKTVRKQIASFKKVILKNMSYEFKSVPVNVENIFGTIKCKEEVRPNGFVNLTSKFRKSLFSKGFTS